MRDRASTGLDSPRTFEVLPVWLEKFGRVFDLLLVSSRHYIGSLAALGDVEEADPPPPKKSKANSEPDRRTVCKLFNIKLVRSFEVYVLVALREWFNWHDADAVAVALDYDSIRIGDKVHFRRLTLLVRWCQKVETLGDILLEIRHRMVKDIDGEWDYRYSAGNATFEERDKLVEEADQEQGPRMGDLRVTTQRVLLSEPVKTKEEDDNRKIDMDAVENDGVPIKGDEGKKLVFVFHYGSDLIQKPISAYLRPIEELLLGFGKNGSRRLLEEEHTYGDQAKEHIKYNVTKTHNHRKIIKKDSQDHRAKDTKEHPESCRREGTFAHRVADLSVFRPRDTLSEKRGSD
ncbi:MAG: hypothetical protein M1835_003031 [Candelina submexicana]|nr:MAG: hypothetical protein M1835_003031 [Candelina submexicana]